MAALVLAGSLALAGCGDDSTGDGDGGDAAGAESATTVAEAPSGTGHPCELLSIAEVKGITGLALDKTERFDPKPGADFNSASCKYSLEEPPGRGARRASVLLSVTRPSDGRRLDQQAAGSFLASTKVGGTDKTIPGIPGATDTGADGGEAAARFGDERIASVRIEANAPITEAGFVPTAKAIEVLKAFVAKGA
jgi:hypothetical protein